MINACESKRPIVRGQSAKEYAAREIRAISNRGRVRICDMTDVPVVTTGIPQLDDVTGIGGLPRGAMVELFGADATAKTSIALRSAATVDLNGGIAVFIDADCKLNLRHMAAVRADPASILVLRPSTAEQTFDVLFSIMRSTHVDLIVVDTVASLRPAQELHDSADICDSNFAGLLSRQFRKVVECLQDTGAALLAVNQLRDAPQVCFGNPTRTPGGRAFRHLCAMRLEVRVLRCERNVELVRREVKVTATKNCFSWERSSAFEVLSGSNGIQFTDTGEWNSRSIQPVLDPGMKLPARRESGQAELAAQGSRCPTVTGGTCK